MYSNYSSYPMMSSMPMSSSSMSSSMPMSSSSIPMSSSMSSMPMSSSNDRFIGGGFLGPFILGGITGGLLAPSFYRPGYGGGYGRPCCYGPYPAPYPYYGPY